MGDNWIPSQKQGGGDWIPPENNNDKRNPPLFHNGEHRIGSNKKQLHNQSLSQEPYAGSCTFEETDIVGLFTEKNYKVAFSVGLNALCIRRINCAIEIGAEPNLLWEDLVKPD